MKILLIILSCCILQPAFAFTHFCPRTFKYVAIGDSIESVGKDCGEPDTVSTGQEDIIDTIRVREWFYHFVSARIISPQKERPSLFFVLYENKVIEIRKLGHIVESTSTCGRGSLVKIGSTEMEVLDACGVSTFRGWSDREIVIGQKEVSRWTYINTALGQSTVLEFDDGILSRIK